MNTAGHNTQWTHRAVGSHGRHPGSRCWGSKVPCSGELRQWYRESPLGLEQFQVWSLSRYVSPRPRTRDLPVWCLLFSATSPLVHRLQLETPAVSCWHLIVDGGSWPETMIPTCLLDIQHVSSDPRASLTLTHQFFDLQLFYKVFILIKAVNTLISLMSSVTRDIYSLVSVLGDGSSRVSLRFLPSSPVKGFSSLTLVEGSGQRTSHLVKDSETNWDLWICPIQIEFEPLNIWASVSVCQILCVYMT